MIHCATSANCLYWTVDEFYHVTAVSKKENASKFYIKPSNHPKHPEEFCICYYDSDIVELQDKDQFDETKEFVEPIPRYLVTPTDAFGRNPGPLKLKYHVRSRDTRLNLVSCIRRRHQTPVSLSEWISGREMCFIQCARRKHMKGYIAVMRNELYCYKTCCIHSRRNEDESRYFMLFQTVRTLETRTNKAVKAAAPAGVIDHNFLSQIPITTYQVALQSQLAPGSVAMQLPIRAPILSQPINRSSPPARPPPTPPLPLQPKPSEDLLIHATEVADTENESDCTKLN